MVKKSSEHTDTTNLDGVSDMKTWDDWSDFDISKAVAKVFLPCDYIFDEDNEKVLLVSTNTYLGAHGEPYERGEAYGEFNALSWSNIGPLAMGSNISITPPCNNRETEGVATGIEFGKNHVRHHHSFFASNDGATRAAAIVFLMMNGVTPDGK